MIFSTNWAFRWSRLNLSVMQMMTFNKQRMEERDQLRELRLEDLRREVQKGIDSGESTSLDLEEIKVRGRERLAGRAAKG